MDIEKREKVAKEIAKTRENIRKKYRALKTGKIDKDIQLEKQYKPLVEPLKEMFVKSSEKNEPIFFPKKSPHESIKRKLFSDTVTPIIKTPRIDSTGYDDGDTDYHDAEDETLQETILPREEEEQLLQRYLQSFLRADKTIDTTYGVYMNNEDKMMLGNSSFEINDNNDDIIINGVTYPGTRGLYELIFKKRPSLHTENDKQHYKNILLTTNVHKRDFKEDGNIKSNRGFKYTKIIAPLVNAPKTIKKTGRGIKLPLDTMTLSNNNIDYVHWDDPNELVERLRLLVSSRQAGNNNHDNEIISIIEELREAGYIL